LVWSKNTEHADVKGRAVAREYYYGGPSYDWHVTGVCVCLTCAYTHMCLYFHTCVTVALYS